MVGGKTGDAPDPGKGLRPLHSCFPFNGSRPLFQEAYPASIRVSIARQLQAWFCLTQAQPRCMLLLIQEASFSDYSPRLLAGGFYGQAEGL